MAYKYVFFYSIGYHNCDSNLRGKSLKHTDAGNKIQVYKYIAHLKNTVFCNIVVFNVTWSVDKGTLYKPHNRFTGYQITISWTLIKWIRNYIIAYTIFLKDNWILIQTTISIRISIQTPEYQTNYSYSQNYFVLFHATSLSHMQMFGNPIHDT